MQFNLFVNDMQLGVRKLNYILISVISILVCFFYTKVLRGFKSCHKEFN